MQGSLDAPPIVIHSSRGSSALMLLIAVGFVAIGVWMLRDPKENAVISYLIIGFFGIGIPLFALRLIRPDVLTLTPDVLTLTPDGMSWRTAFRSAQWTWDDVENFRAYAPTGKTISKHLGFDFTDNYHAKRGGSRGIVKAITSVEGSLGTGWEMSAADLAELLTKAKARWATDPR
jgi:hypothetical protein